MLTFALLVCGVGGVNATKLYATYGTPAGNGSWDAENKTYSWTGISSNLMDLFTFANGELASYKSLHFTTSDYVTGPYRVCFMTGSTAVATIAFYSAGQKNLVFSERDETKDLDLTQITSIKFGGASGAGSIKITQKPYLQKPMTLTWADDGTAEIDLTDLTASGGFSLNDQTGVLTGTGESGSLKINFPTGGVDLSALTGFSVTYTGDNLFNNFEIGDGTTNKGFWSNVTGRDDLNQHMTAGNVGAPTAITNWKWNNNSTASTMTISSIKLKGGVITASNPHETFLTTAMFVGGCENHIGEGNVGAGTTIYGNGSVLADQYVDLSAYDEMRIYGTPNKSIRLLFNWTSANQKEISGADVKLNGDGYYSLDLSTVAPQQLNAFKFPYDGQSGAITKVILYKNSIPVPYSYVVSGVGQMTPSATAALADANATSIDATGLTNTSAIALESANPNCLFVANAGKLSNTKNVIVDNVCANLELTDEKPFKAPVAFTATKASFSKTVTAAGYATLVLPFNADVAEGVEAYNIESESAGVLTTTVAEAIVANKPVMIKADDASYSFKADGVAVPATPAGAQQNGLLYGVYETTDVPTSNGYVLQKHDADVNFYKAANGQKVNAFRAYLATAAGARELSFDFNTTGVNGVKVNSENAEVYNLNGQRVAAPQKGLYIVGAKKVIVK